MRTLIVDDYLDTAILLTKLLTHQGHEAKYVVSGQEAIDSILSDRPDFVLLDLMLPDITGMDVLKKVRAENYTGIIIMLTAVADMEQRNLAAASGANFYLVKASIDFKALDKMMRDVREAN